MNPGRLSPSMFNIMIDKIQGSIHHWSSNLLSYAGKLQLINAVVFGLENFWCSVLLLPSHIIKIVNKLCKDYFWGISGKQRRMTFKGWSSICKPWLEGGYNVKELLSWNKALLSKWVWHLTQNRDGIWDRWNRTYNYRDHTIWEAQSRSWHAESWRDIIKTKNFLLEIAGSSANAQRMLNACVTHGQFSVGKAYHFFRDKGHSTRWVAALTAPCIMPKHRLCTIQAGQRQLPTVDNLSKRGFFHINWCCLCCNASESHRHLFFRCPFSLQVRNFMLLWLGFSVLGDAYDIKDCLYKLLGGSKQKKWRNDAAAICV
ncbi:uncharacterized protein LOC141617035 [Silene latifolia]|uniref:uncharacterized protein LOC141617035 n=1 Tax=Silene latifolia TaxID=37657 RepID=UPI003D7829A4